MLIGDEETRRRRAALKSWQSRLECADYELPSPFAYRSKVNVVIRDPASERTRDSPLVCQMAVLPGDDRDA
jgi:hypothetical protein